MIDTGGGRRGLRAGDTFEDGKFLYNLYEKFDKKTADLMLGDRHLFVAKAVGWVLRESGRSHPELVLAYLEPRVQQMASVTVREALKPLRCADRQRLQARRAAGPRAPGGRATVGR